MPVTFQILPTHGLVYVRFDGEARLGESQASMQAYRHHPDYRPGQKQLIDMSRVTGFERDFPRIIALMAEVAEIFHQPGVEMMAVYYVTNRHGRDVARLVMQSWADIPGIVTRMTEDEAAALSILGMKERTIAALFAAAT